MNREDNFNKRELIKALRESTGAPLNMCLKALQSCENDVERAREWISKNFKPKPMSNSHLRYFSFYIGDRHPVIGILEFNSDISMRTPIANQVIGDIRKALESSDIPLPLSKALEMSGNTILTGIIDSNKVKLKEDIKLLTCPIFPPIEGDQMGQFTYLHMRDEGISFSCYKGVVVVISDLLDQGELRRIALEIHYSLNIDGSKVRLGDYRGRQFLERYASLKTMEGGSLQDIVPEDLRIILTE